MELKSLKIDIITYSWWLPKLLFLLWHTYNENVVHVLHIALLSPPWSDPLSSSFLSLFPHFFLPPPPFFLPFWLSSPSYLPFQPLPLISPLSKLFPVTSPSPSLLLLLLLGSFPSSYLVISPTYACLFVHEYITHSVSTKLFSLCRIVHNMRELKTDVGHARAWVR